MPKKIKDLEITKEGVLIGLRRQKEVLFAEYKNGRFYVKTKSGDKFDFKIIFKKNGNGD